MEFPIQAHMARDRQSFSRPFPNNSPLLPLDIEAARAAERAREQKAWNNYQWSEHSWDNTAVDERSNSFDGYSRRSSKDGKSDATSFAGFDIHDGAQASPSFNRYEKKAPAVAVQEVSNPPLSTVHSVALVAICCLAQFLNLAGMNQTVASVMILSDYFDIRDYGTLSWFSAAYSMSVGTFILPAGEVYLRGCATTS